MVKKIGYMTKAMMLAGTLMLAVPVVAYADPEVRTVEALQQGDASADVSGSAYSGPGAPKQEAAPAPVVNQSETRRQALVSYAMQFVGGPYRYGGTDPHTGVDCSGFTRYVMQHGAGVSLSRSSSSQATQGVTVSAEQMRPGDLIFYGSGRSVNHVGMYIGNGQIVHASTYSTGIKTSPWNYRSPVRIANVLGD